MKDQKHEQQQQIDPQVVIKEMKNEMSITLEKFSEEIKKIKTGRAHPSLLDGIKVFLYESELPIKQVALVTIESPSTLLIQPHDSSTIAAIEKAILQSGRDLVPSNDGKVIRIKISPLTQEAREKLIKLVRKKAEEFKVSVRNIRDKARNKIRDIKTISEDKKRKILDDIEKETNQIIAKIESLNSEKEKEILS